jgi:hypothetical protein
MSPAIIQHSLLRASRKVSDILPDVNLVWFYTAFCVWGAALIHAEKGTRDVRNEGRKEGSKQARKQGSKESRNQGTKDGRKEGKNE